VDPGVGNGYEGLVAKDGASVYEGRADAAMAEGQAEGLDGRRGRLAAADLDCLIVADIALLR
jgi:hypothetical protein